MYFTSEGLQRYFDKDYKKKNPISDLRVRQYMNISEYEYNIKEHEQMFWDQGISFYNQNDSTLVTGFIIQTIDGKYEIPVIGMKHIRKKLAIKMDLPFQIQIINNVRRKRCEKLLLENTKLPIEIIMRICEFI